MPPATACRGGGDRRSDQPWAAHLWRRAQRISACVSGVWCVLCREPRAVCRGAGNPQARLDAGTLQLRRPVLSLQGRVPGAEAVPEAVSGNPGRCDQSGHIPGQRCGGPSDLLCHALGRSVGTRAKPGGVSRRLGRRWPPRRRPSVHAGAGLCRTDRATRAVRAGRERDALLPLPRSAHRGVCQPGRRARHREPRRAGATAAEHHLRRGAGQQDHRRNATAGGGSA